MSYIMFLNVYVLPPPLLIPSWKSPQPENLMSEKHGVTGFRRWCATAQRTSFVSSSRTPLPCPSAICRRIRRNIQVVIIIQFHPRLHLACTHLTPRPSRASTKLLSSSKTCLSSTTNISSSRYNSPAMDGSQHTLLSCW